MSILEDGGHGDIYRDRMPPVDCIGLALDLVEQANRVESQTVHRAMMAAVIGLRRIASGASATPPESGGQVEEPEVWVNRCPYKHSRNVFCPSCLKTRPPGAVHGQPVAHPTAQARGAVTEEVAKRIYYMRRDFDLSTVERTRFWAQECRDIVEALAQGGGNER